MQKCFQSFDISESLSTTLWNTSCLILFHSPISARRQHQDLHFHWWGTRSRKQGYPGHTIQTRRARTEPHLLSSARICLNIWTFIRLTVTRTASTCPVSASLVPRVVLNQSFSNLTVYKESLGILLKCRFRFAGLGWGLRLCISNKHPGDTESPKTILWVSRCKMLFLI